MAIAAAPQMNATDEPEVEEGNSSEYMKIKLLGIFVLAGVVVLLIFGYLIFTFRRGGMIPLEAMQTQFGTWGQPDICSCLGYRDWLNVLNSAVAYPHETDTSMPGEGGGLSPTWPLLSPQTMCSASTPLISVMP